jgi:hypothetical protein
MTFRNTVTIVASPRSRGGKTLLARLLVDYHRQENRGVQAFDLNTGENTLSQFLPGEVTAAGVASVKSQMALFDSLVSPDQTAKIVDVGHEAFESFFALAHRIGFVDEARRRDIAPVILFMIGADPVSAEAYRNLRTRFPRATLSPVHNEMLGSAQHRDKFPSAGAGAAQLRLPMLAPGLRKYIEQPPFSFSDTQLANAKHIPLDVHIELQRWLRKMHIEFRELDLRILLAHLQTSLQFKP